VALTLAFWVAALDPFQMNTRFDSASQAGADRMVAPFYDQDKSEPRISNSLMLITVDAATVRRDHAYPVAYDELAAVVQAAADQDAKAVFLDFAFFNRGLDPTTSASRGLTLLVGAIVAAKAAGVAVFTGPIDVDPALNSLRSAVSGEAAISWTADHPLDYRFVGEDFYGRKLPTPAVLLYRAYCANPAKGEPACDPRLLKSLTRPTSLLDKVMPLAVQFGNGPAAGQNRFIDLSPCRGTAAPEWALALARGVQQAALGPPPPPCPSRLELPVQYLAGAMDLLKGRLVVVGLTPDLGDGYIAPGVGRIAGGAVNLMAVDNLIHYGAAYPRWPSNWFWGLSWTGAFKIAIVFLIPIVIEEAGRLARRRQHDKRTLLWAIFAAVLLVPSCGAVLFGMVFHTPLGGVIGLALLSLGVTAFFEDEALVAELGIRFGPTVALRLLILIVAVGLVMASLASGQATFGIEAALLAVLALGLMLPPRWRGRRPRNILAHPARTGPTSGDG